MPMKRLKRCFQEGAFRMWVKAGNSFYNTDHIITLERKEDAGVYYLIRFSDGTDTGLNEKQIKPLADALEQLAAEKKGPEGAASHNPPEANKAEASPPPVITPS